MDQPPQDFTRHLHIRSPAAVVHIWPDDSKSRSEEVREHIGRLLLDTGGIYPLGPTAFAVLPEAKDPAPFDTAVHICRRLPAVLAKREGSRRDPPGLGMLIAPGEVTIRDRQAELKSDPFGEDLQKAPPPLESHAVYLTGWAAHQLEHPCQIISQPPFQGPSGRAFPLVKVGPMVSSTTPWRNPELLGRQLKRINRPRLLESMRDLLANAASRVRGPVGCGKTRVVWDAVQRSGSPLLWLRVQSPRRRDLPLGLQIAQQLLSPQSRSADDRHHPRIHDREQREELRRRLKIHLGTDKRPEETELAQWVLVALDRLFSATGEPVWVICDDLEQIDASDLDFLSNILDSPRLGETFRLVLVGRGGVELPADIEGLPTLEVGRFEEREMGEYATQLFGGLSLPISVQTRLLQTTTGYPFALEEGMVALIREKSMRRIYGSFFFSGDEDADYSPSLRLVCHLQAEASRLAGPVPFYILSHLETGAPPAPVGAAASSLTSWSGLDWEVCGLESGLLRRTESPWGPGIAISCPANALALSYAIAPESAVVVHQVLGESVAEHSQSGEAHWETYRLLRGTPQAVEALLKVTESSFVGQIAREELLAALTEEMRLHRQREGDSEIELELLWRVLPIARRLGQVQNLAKDLARGLELAVGQPGRMLALAGTKAELDQEAGRFREAEATMQSALQLARDTDHRRQALLLIQLGRLFLRQQRYDEATELFTNLRKALEQQGSAALAATCEYFLGNIAFHEKRLEDAMRHHQAALEKRREQNLLRPIGSSLSALGAVCVAMGNYPQALAAYQEAHEILVDHGKKADVSYTLRGLASAYTRLGDFASASQPIREALRIRAGKDDVAGEAIARLEVAENFLLLGQPAAALEDARKAHFQLTLLSLEPHLANAEQLLGRIFLSQRRYEEAEAHLRVALEKHKEQGNNLASGFDRAWLLEKALFENNAEGIRKQAIGLRELVAKLDQTDRSEQLDYRLYLGLDWLKKKGHNVGDPVSYLERAYRELLRKASHLRPDQRHQFVYQNDQNQAIVDAAAKQGLLNASSR
jgi:tetratricopeptide (TPR) repeat protein